VEKKSELEPYFSVENVKYDIDKGEGIVVPTVYCSDIIGYVRKVSVARALDDDKLHKKIGIDSGKGSLKVTLSLFSDEDVTDKSKKKGFSNTGHKRVLVLAAVPKVNESYSNIKILLNLIKLKLLDNYWITG